MLQQGGKIRRDTIHEKKLRQAETVAKILNDTFYIEFLKEHIEAFLEKVE